MQVLTKSRAPCSLDVSARILSSDRSNGRSLPRAICGVGVVQRFSLDPYNYPFVAMLASHSGIFDFVVSSHGGNTVRQCAPYSPSLVEHS